MLNKTSIWQTLEKLYKQTHSVKMSDLFADDPERSQRFSVQSDELYLDYSKNRLSPEIFNHLIDLAEQADLGNAIEAMFNGDELNFTEQRPALHTLLRAENPGQEVTDTLNKMDSFVNAVLEGQWRGYTDHAITDVVHIGIGGSDLGPRMVVDALSHYQQPNLQVHFVANIDGTDISRTLKKLDPQTTLFIVASKSFTTIETLTNAKAARQWLLGHLHDDNAVSRHFVAVSAKPERAREFGIATDNVFAFWDWVGGRYSLWSAIGLPIALALGMDNFHQLLAGARAMDTHFRAQPLETNMPVIMAVLTIWYNNFYHSTNEAIIPYDEHLKLLPAFLQQLIMESNGKAVNQKGQAIDYATSPVIWGDVGSNGQHAFHQLLHQGQQLIPVDFIIALRNHHPLHEQHELLFANCLAQSQALLYGRTEQQAYNELIADGASQAEAKRLAPHKVLPGNKPSNTLVMQALTPKSLGSLLALYEHKVFVEGVIWQINSFDQYGVELGKQVATTISNALKNDGSLSEFDSSTRHLIEQFKHQP